MSKVEKIQEKLDCKASSVAYLLER